MGFYGFRMMADSMYIAQTPVSGTMYIKKFTNMMNFLVEV